MTSKFPFLQNPDLRRVLAALNEHYETRVVGGAVRNALRGLPIADIDLATTALPAEVERLGLQIGCKVIPTGIDHGTVTLMLGQSSFEVTTLREDVATDGRHAEVKFGTDFHADAMRRDFTINALSISANGELFDYTGGVADITSGTVRFIGEADLRIKEDYLRILRFFRFSSSYAKGDFDATALAAIIENRHGLTQLSKERISTELFKILLTRRVEDVTKIMSDSGLLQIALGGIVNPAVLKNFIAIKFNPPNQLDRLAALALMSQSDIPRLRDALRLSNNDMNALKSAARAEVDLHNRMTPPEKGQLREMLFLHGKPALLLALQLALARSGASPDNESWQSALRFTADTPQPTLPFTGADLLARGLQSGSQMGQTLKNLQSLWIRAGFPKDPQSLSALLDEALSEASIPLRH